MNDFYIVHEAECTKEFSEKVLHDIRSRSVRYEAFTPISPPISPSHSLLDKIAQLENDNETLRQNLKRAEEALDLVACIQNRSASLLESASGPPDHAKRIRKIAALMRIGNSSNPVLGTDQVEAQAQIDSLKRQLDQERSARLASERKLRQIIKEKRSSKLAYTDQVKDML